MVQWLYSHEKNDSQRSGWAYASLLHVIYLYIHMWFCLSFSSYIPVQFADGWIDWVIITIHIHVVTEQQRGKGDACLQPLLQGLNLGLGSWQFVILPSNQTTTLCKCNVHCPKWACYWSLFCLLQHCPSYMALNAFDTYRILFSQILDCLINGNDKHNKC